jgi:hypothetical protein
MLIVGAQTRDIDRRTNQTKDGNENRFHRTGTDGQRHERAADRAWTRARGVEPHAGARADVLERRARPLLHSRKTCIESDVVITMLADDAAIEAVWITPA